MGCLYLCPLPTVRQTQRHTQTDTIIAILRFRPWPIKKQISKTRSSKCVFSICRKTDWVSFEVRNLLFDWPRSIIIRRTAWGLFIYGRLDRQHTPVRCARHDVEKYFSSGDADKGELLLRSGPGNRSFRFRGHVTANDNYSFPV